MKTSKIMKSMLMRVTLHRGDADEDSAEAVGTGNDARVALLNGIGDNADRERGEDFADVNDDGSTSAFEAPPADEVDDEAAAANEAAATEQARIDAEQLAAVHNDEPVKIVRKINGVQVEITDEMLAKASKIAAADMYLAEAKRMREELAAQAAGKTKAVETVEPDLAEIARAIQMGTEEEAVAALRKLTPPSPSKQPDDFATKFDERLTFNSAYTAFCTEFNDIVSDPRLKRMAEEADAQLCQAGDTRPYSERFTAIGKDIRAWIGSKAPAVANPELAAKEQRKAAAPAVPKAASGKHVQPTDEEKEESVADTIRAMAEKRGGPQWMNGAGR